MKKTNNKEFFVIILLVILTLGSLSVNAFSSDKISMYLSLDQNSSTLLNSPNPSINASVVSGTTFVNNTACHSGGCRNFTGTGDRFTITGLNTSMNSNLSTINFWTNVRSFDQYDTFVICATSSSGASPYQELMSDYYTNGYFSFHNANSGASVKNEILTSKTDNINNMTMYTYTANGTHYSLYENGVFKYSNSTGYNIPISDMFKYCMFGNSWGATTRGINAIIDDITILNTSVNSSEVQQFILYDYPFQSTTTTLPLFINQSPSDITSTNAFGIPTIIYYNMSMNDNKSLEYLEYQIQGGNIYINGSLVVQPQNKSVNNYTGNISTFLLNDNNIYPATYNINEDIMMNTPHNFYTMTGVSDVVKVELINVSTTLNYNIIEIMLNSTNNVNIYYCNSSYTTGLPAFNNNCGLVSTFNSLIFNHTYNYSRHNVFNLPISSGLFGSVKVTSTSYIVIKPQVLQTAQLGYINGSSRTNVFQTSGNGGLSYTSFNGTPDLHIHQYLGTGNTENLTYRACYINTSNSSICSIYQTDNIGITNLPPTSVFIETINDTLYYGENLSISWDDAITQNTSKINYYNITLVDSSFNVVKQLGLNTSTNDNIYTSIINLKPDYYLVRIEAVDNNSLSSYGYSNTFFVSQEFLNDICTTANDFYYTTNSTGGGVNITFDYSTDNTILDTEIIASNLFYNETIANDTGSFRVTLPQDSYELYFYTSNNDSTKSYYDGMCSINIWTCTNDWEQTIQPCVANTKLISYTDINNCNEKYDIPSDNGTYIACTTPPDTDKDLWLLILLLILWIIGIIITFMYMPLAIILNFIISAVMYYYTFLYFDTNILGICFFIATTLCLVVAIKIK